MLQLTTWSRILIKTHLPYRGFSTLSQHPQQKALILGVYSSDSPKTQSGSDGDYVVEGTRSFQKCDAKLEGKLGSLLKLTKPLKPGKSRVYHGVGEDLLTVAVVSLGERNGGNSNNNEGVDLRKEAARKATAAGLKSLSELGIDEVEVDVMEYPTAAAEGVFLSSWSYKKTDREKLPAKISPLDDEHNTDWEEGKILAEGQNFARFLMESPPNLMNPTVFANTVKEKAESSGKDIKVVIRDEGWIKNQNMGAFLSVSQGSSQPPKFLEIHYKGPESLSRRADPLVLVGKGVTFDSGGLSLKPSKAMIEMRADMGGAATVASSIWTAASLDTPGNFLGLIPLCENMPNGHANRPSDVVTAKDGTTIQIDNTDAEGRLLLADALSYSRDFNPAAIVDVATLTGAMVVALGAGATGTFSNCDKLWEHLQEAGYSTGDRMWRMPLYQLYMDQVKPSHLADINNIGKAGGAGGSCTAAAFLNHFVQKGTRWAHLDIAGVMTNDKGEVPYLGSGMAGRPSRTLAEFMKRFS